MLQGLVPLYYDWFHLFADVGENCKFCNLLNVSVSFDFKLEHNDTDQLFHIGY